MQGDWPGLAGGVAGAVLGLLGGVYGTWCSIRSGRSAAERRFLVKVSAVTWGALLLLIGLPLALSWARVIPQWLYWVAFALFFAPLVPFILWANRRQTALRGGQKHTVPA